MWPQMNVVLNEVVSNECGLKWSGLKWMCSQMNVVSNECGLKQGRNQRKISGG